MDTWNVVSVTDMNALFTQFFQFNEPISSWNTARVTNMRFMFYECIHFNHPLGDWNTVSVTSMESMFVASNFNQPIGDWNTGSVTTMARLFAAVSTFTQPIGDWNTGSVIDMYQMLYNAKVFNQPIGDWNIGIVTNTQEMFSYAVIFNNPIGNWNTGRVTNMLSMFSVAYRFNRPVGAWDTSRVTTMMNMFREAYSFNQPLGAWDTSRVINFDSFLQSAHGFCQPSSSLPASMTDEQFEDIFLPFDALICMSCPTRFPNCVACTPQACLECANSTFVLRGDSLDWISSRENVEVPARCGKVENVNAGCCIDSCPAYFFGNGSGIVGRACETCEASCTSCSDVDECTECTDGKFLHDSKCFYFCPLGTVARNIGTTGSYCLLCEVNCATCSDSSECLTCSGRKYLHESDCVDACPEGSSANGLAETGRMCASCGVASCLRCPSVDICEICDGRYLHDGECVIECPSGTFASQSILSQTCQGCQSDCSSCTNASMCSVCTNSKYLHHDNCVELCPTGTEPLGMGITGSFCKACTKYIHDDACVEVCPIGFFPDERDTVNAVNLCLSCEKRCSSCSDASTCVLCDTSTYLLNNDCVDACPLGTEGLGTETTGLFREACPQFTYNQRCVDECPSGTFPSEADGYRLCRSCELHCSSCINATTCLLCSDSKYLFEQACWQSCPLGTFAVAIGSVGFSCQACDDRDCAQCQDASTCTSCKISKFLYLGGCLSSCPSRTVTIGSACFDCDNRDCLNCSTQAVCKTCANSTYLHKDDCVKECPTGTFEDSQEDGERRCRSCQGDCSLCVSRSACLGCMNGKYLNDGDCLEACPSGTVPSGTGSVGLSCHDPDKCSFIFTVSLETGDCEPNWPLWSASLLSMLLLIFVCLVVFIQRRSLKALLFAVDTNKEHRIEAALNRAKKCGISSSNQSIKAGERQLKILRQKYTDFEALLQILDRGMEFGDMKLLRGSWLMHSRNIHRFRRQQELPKEAFWSPNELRSQLTVVSIVAISYCWLHPVNPDPHSKHLQELQRAVKLRLELKGPGQIQDLAIFLDYASIPQHGEQGDEQDPVQGQVRSKTETAAFKNGLKNVNIPYASQLTETWMMKWVPDEEPRKYMMRGWPYFEQAVSSLIKPTTMLIELHTEALNAQSWIDVHEKGKIGRKPPLIPSKFKEELFSKSFTNGKEDFEFVDGKYRETFKDVVGTATALWFAGVGWTDSDAEVFTEIYPYAINLERLLLSDNMFSKAGAEVLIRECVTCPSLLYLDLSHNRFCEGSIDDLQQIWESIGKPRNGLRIEASESSSGSGNVVRLEGSAFEAKGVELLDQTSGTVIGSSEYDFGIDKGDTANTSLVEL